MVEKTEGAAVRRSKGEDHHPGQMVMLVALPGEGVLKPELPEVDIKLPAGWRVRTLVEELVGPGAGEVNKDHAACPGVIHHIFRATVSEIVFEGLAADGRKRLSACVATRSIS